MFTAHLLNADRQKTQLKAWRSAIDGSSITAAACQHLTKQLFIRTTSLVTKCHYNNAQPCSGTAASLQTSQLDRRRQVVLKIHVFAND